MSEENAAAGWYPTDQGLRYWTGSEWGPLAPSASVPAPTGTAAPTANRKTGLRWVVGIVAGLFTYGALFKGAAPDAAFAVFLWWAVAALGPGWKDRSREHRADRIVPGVVLLFFGAGVLTLTMMDPGVSPSERSGG